MPKKIVLTDTPIIIIIRSRAILQRGLYNLSKRFGLRCRIADNEVASYQLPREGKGLRIGRLFGYGTSSEVALVLDEYCR